MHFIAACSIPVWRKPLLTCGHYMWALHAITSAIKRWTQYLLGHLFVIQTDHKRLEELLIQVIQTLEQQHYVIKLLGYDYEIQYKPGSTNVVADALSRASDDSSNSLFHLSVPQFLFLKELKNDLQQYATFLKLMEKILQNLSTLPEFRLVDDMLLRRGRIWISPTSKFKHLLL